MESYSLIFISFEKTSFRKSSGLFVFKGECSSAYISIQFFNRDRDLIVKALEYIIRVGEEEKEERRSEKDVPTKVKIK